MLMIFDILRFAYANKVWETIKKSSMISEYNRLMT